MFKDFKDIPKNPSGYGMKLTSEEIEQAVAEMRGEQMNNLQHIVKDNTRFAMHMAIELCERGDFDSVGDALRWLLKERETVECEPSTCVMEEDVGATQTLLTCSRCGYTSKDRHPLFCGGCGRAVRWKR